MEIVLFADRHQAGTEELHQHSEVHMIIYSIVNIHLITERLAVDRNIDSALTVYLNSEYEAVDTT